MSKRLSREERAAIRVAMRLLGQRTSPKKAAAAVKNGRLGGWPGHFKKNAEGA